MYASMNMRKFSIKLNNLLPSLAPPPPPLTLMMDDKKLARPVAASRMLLIIRVASINGFMQISVCGIRLAQPSKRIKQLIVHAAAFARKSWRSRATRNFL